MKKKSYFKQFNTFVISLGVLVLIILVYRTSDLLLSNSLNNFMKLDKKTSSYISFSYADRDINSVFEIYNPKVFSDFKGKRFVGEYYDFDVNVPKGNDDVKYVGFDILLKDMGNNIDDKFIKVYLTDQNNKALDGFDQTVPVYSAFLNDLDGKIIYSGCFADGDNSKFRLRVWISDVYNRKYKNSLFFQIKVKIK